jgi:integrase
MGSGPGMTCRGGGAVQMPAALSSTSGCPFSTSNHLSRQEISHMIVDLKTVVPDKLVCEEGRRKQELVDIGRSGLFCEVRATSPGQGTYYIRWKQDGRTRHKKLGTTTEISLDEARERAKRLKAAITLGIDPRMEVKPDVSTLTYSEFFEKQALPYLKTRKFSWDKDEQYFRLRLKKAFGHKKLDEITRHEIQTFLMALKDEGLAAATCNHHVKSLRHTLAIALDWELIEKNPAAKISLIPLNNKIECIPDQEQMGRFIRVLRADDSVIARLIEFLLLTSCRLNEGAQLRWTEVDLKAKVVTLAAHRTKGKRARTLPLSEIAVDLLKSLDSYERSTYVFPNPKTGKPYRSPYKKFHSLKAKAGMPNSYRIHDCRHWALTQVVSNNHSLESAKLLAGHASSQITERYLHCSVQHLREPTETVAKALEDAMKTGTD